MSLKIRNLLVAGILGIVATVAPSVASAQIGTTQRTNLIILSHNELRPTFDAPLIQLIRQRLPLGVHQGRFVAKEGESTFCIFSRRSSAPMALSPAGDSLPACPMISVYLDGKVVQNPGAFLTAARANDLQSVELVNDTAALKRYGVFDEVLSLWTKGHGPYAQRKPLRMNDDASSRF